MSPVRHVRLSRILGAVLLCVAGLVVLGWAFGIRLNLKNPASGGLLSWGAPRSGDLPTGAELFRMREQVLTARFAALKGACASRWASDAACLAQLKQMRAMEETLFADVRAHEFTDQADSDYWHGGRLESPSEIQQTLDQAVNR